KAAFEPAGTAADLGNGFRHPATGTGFCCYHIKTTPAQKRAQLGGKRFNQQYLIGVSQHGIRFWKRKAGLIVPRSTTRAPRRAQAFFARFARLNARCQPVPKPLRTRTMSAFDRA